MIRRHSLAWLKNPPPGPDMAMAWQGSGNPFIVCRTRPGEEVSLGFCLPPTSPDLPPRRIGLAVSKQDLAEVIRPPAFPEFKIDLPESVSAELEKLAGVCAVRLIGSRLWQFLLDVPYTRPGSDLDLVLDFSGTSRIEAVSEILGPLVLGAPVRIDPEIALADGRDFAWREWISPTPEILVKSTSDLQLVSRSELAAFLP